MSQQTNGVAVEALNAAAPDLLSACTHVLINHRESSRKWLWDLDAECECPTCCYLRPIVAKATGMAAGEWLNQNYTRDR